MRKSRVRSSSKINRALIELLEVRRLLAADDTAPDTIPALFNTTPTAQFFDGATDQNVIVNSTIDTSKDVDMYEIIVDQFSTVTVSVDPLGTNFDLYLSVFNTEYNDPSSPLRQHFEDDNSGGGLGASATFLGDADQVWYIIVSSAANHNINPDVASSGPGGPTGAFQVRFSSALGSVTGKVFNDADGSKSQNGTEAGLANRQVYADVDNNSSYGGNDISATTESDGSYNLGGLTDATYVVRLTPVSGETLTTPTTGFVSASISGGSTVGSANFGTKQPAATAVISGSVSNDANQNGFKDGSETGVAGVTIFLDTNNNGTKDAGENTTATTDANGSYAFNNLPAGSYHVRPVIPAGFRSVLGSVTSYDVTLTTGATAPAKSFALTSFPLVSGNVFNDANGNLAQDAGEAGIAGVTVYVDLNNDKMFQPATENSQTTDAKGAFTFRFLPNGALILRAVSPNGFAQTTPTNGTGLHVTTSNGAVIDAGTIGEKSTTATGALTSIAINEQPTGSTTTITDGRDYDVVAGGPGVAGTSDGFRFLYAPKTGDFDVKVQVTSLTVAGNFSTAGILARTDLTAGSPDVYMSASPTNYRFKSRATAGAAQAVTAAGTVSFPNAWVRLKRVGNTFTGYSSTNGFTWTQISSVTIALPSTINLGLAVASNNNTQTTTAKLRNYQNTNLTSVAIGETPAGSTTTINPGTDYDVTAGGPGVAGTSDGFRFLYAKQTGDFDMKVQVTSLTVAGSFSTAGILARTDLTAGSPDVYMSASPTNYRFKSRATAGAAQAVTAVGTVSFPNVWVRLKRAGNTFTGYFSTNGTTWTQVSSVTIALPSTIYLGLAVASNNNTQTTTAKLRNYSTT